ncbi:MAG: hypothetical protein JF606_20715 [Burkholderiales bacterium]|nr:hypothetical protein [Burkholderiales bacterium]
MGYIDRFIHNSGLDIAESFDAAPDSALNYAHRRPTWTQAEVVALMEALYPPPTEMPGDQAVLRQQLSSAFLAGAAESCDELLLRPPRSLVMAASKAARTLLKNRAAHQHGRLWHAFMAGSHAGRATAGFDATDGWKPAPSMRLHGAIPEAARGRSSSAADITSLRLFVRQPLTESGESQQALIAAVLERINAHDGAPHSFRYLTGQKAESADTFRQSFESETGLAFEPRAFRTYRLNLLAQADAFINIRVGMSESSAFELSYHVFRGACTPVLFLVWKHSPIKTTLLKDLGNLCDVTYLEFEHADDLCEGIGKFFLRCRSQATSPMRTSMRPSQT